MSGDSRPDYEEIVTVVKYIACLLKLYFPSSCSATAALHSTEIV